MALPVLLKQALTVVGPQLGDLAKSVSEVVIAKIESSKEIDLEHDKGIISSILSSIDIGSVQINQILNYLDKFESKDYEELEKAFEHGRRLLDNSNESLEEKSKYINALTNMKEAYAKATNTKLTILGIIIFVLAVPVFLLIGKKIDARTFEKSLRGKWFGK